MKHIKNNRIKLCDFATVIMGQSPSSKFYNEEGKGLPFFQGVTDFGYKYPNETCWTTVAPKKAETNDVLFSVWAPVGDVNIANKKCCIGRGIAAIRSKTNQVDYLYYLLKYQSIKIQRLGTGAVYDAVKKSDLENILLDVFEDTNTQSEVGSSLVLYDNLIDTNRRRIQLLEETARLLFREWFVYFRFPGHEKIKIVDGVPEGWEKLQIKDIIRTVNSRKKIQKSEYDEAGLYPCVDQSQEYTSGYTDRKDYVINNTIPIVIFGDHTRIIKYVDFPFVSGADGTQLLVSKHNKITSEFLYFILKNINLSNYFYARHFKFLKDQWIFVPSEYLCSSFNLFSKDIMKQIGILRNQNQKLTQARDLLLPRLMSGAIDPIRYDKLSNGVEV